MILLLAVPYKVKGGSEIELQKALRTAKDDKQSFTVRKEALDTLLSGEYYTNKWVQAFIKKRVDDKNIYNPDRQTIIRYMILHNENPTPTLLELFHRVVDEKWRSMDERTQAINYLLQNDKDVSKIITTCRRIINEKWRLGPERVFAQRYLMEHGDVALKAELKAEYPKQTWRNPAELSEMANAR